MGNIVLGEDFFHRDVLEVAPDLVGKLVVRTFEDGSEASLRITEKPTEERRTPPVTPAKGKPSAQRYCTENQE